MRHVKEIDNETYDETDERSRYETNMRQVNKIARKSDNETDEETLVEKHA